MSDQIKQALCCVCGALRTCRRPRNYRQENFWLSSPVDRDWHRETGDLKCAQCSRITTHAIVLPENDTRRDHAEQIHRMAIGWQFKNHTDGLHQRVRDRWREGLPRNPFLQHQWWIADETKAREAGDTHFKAICQENIPLPKKVSKKGTGVARDVFMKPKQYGREEEYEDPETGLSWVWMTCPDCYLRSNAIALDEQRKALKDKLLDVASKFSTLDAGTVRYLLSQFDEGGA